jgi:hypothetical protein
VVRTEVEVATVVPVPAVIVHSSSAAGANVLSH